MIDWFVVNVNLPSSWSTTHFWPRKYHKSDGRRVWTTSLNETRIENCRKRKRKAWIPYDSAIWRQLSKLKQLTRVLTLWNFFTFFSGLADLFHVLFWTGSDLGSKSCPRNVQFKTISLREDSSQNEVQFSVRRWVSRYNFEIVWRRVVTHCKLTHFVWFSSQTEKWTSDCQWLFRKRLLYRRIQSKYW